MGHLKYRKLGLNLNDFATPTEFYKSLETRTVRLENEEQSKRQNSVLLDTLWADQGIIL